MDLDELTHPPTSAEGSSFKFKVKALQPEPQDAQMGGASTPGSHMAPTMAASPASMSASISPGQASASTQQLPSQVALENAAVATIVAPIPQAAVEPPAKKKRGPAKKKADKPPLPEGEVKPHWRRGLKGKASDAAAYYNSKLVSMIRIRLY